MRKVITILAALLTLSGCKVQAQENKSMANEKKILTVYFSMKGQTIWSDWSIKDLKEGNTAVAAKYIQKAVGGDIFKASPLTPLQRERGMITMINNNIG